MPGLGFEACSSSLGPYGNSTFRAYLYFRLQAFAEEVRLLPVRARLEVFAWAAISSGLWSTIYFNTFLLKEPL